MENITLTDIEERYQKLKIQHASKPEVLSYLEDTHDKLRNLFTSGFSDSERSAEAKKLLERVGLIGDKKEPIQESRNQVDYSNILRNVTNIQSRNDIENNNLQYTNENIIIPDNLYSFSKQIANYSNETTGVLIARKQNNENKNFYIIEYAQILGEGNEYNVQIDDNKKDAMVDFLSENPELVAIEFHTHTIQTGQSWNDKFSSQDYTAIGKAIKNNINYKHILFTPENILTVGKSKMSVHLAKTSPEASKKNIEKYIKHNERYRQILNTKIG